MPSDRQQVTSRMFANPGDPTGIIIARDEIDLFLDPPPDYQKFALDYAERTIEVADAMIELAGKSYFAAEQTKHLIRQLYGMVPPPIRGGTFLYCPWETRPGPARGSVNCYKGNKRTRFRTESKYRQHYRKHHD
jgi:hypothetical protein